MFAVAIPSYRRPSIVVERTLHFCCDELGLEPSHVYLFLAQEDPDLPLYLPHAERIGCQVRYGPVGLHHMRNEMARCFHAMAQGAGHPIRVLYLDDDIEHFVQMIENPNLPIKSSSRYSLQRVTPTDFLALVRHAFSQLEQHGWDLFGFYPVKNGYFMKDLPEQTHDLRFCVGAAYGMVHWPHAAPYVLELEEKEDFERTLLSYQRNGGVLRLNRVAPVTSYYKTAGGLQSRGYDRKRVAAEACAHLLQRFPGLCRPYHGKKTGMPEVRLITQKQ